MEDFEILVHFNGKDWLFPARLLHSGYSHKFEVMVNDRVVYFEPDEEKQYRAVVDAEQASAAMDVHLLQAIATAIEEILK